MLGRVVANIAHEAPPPGVPHVLYLWLALLLSHFEYSSVARFKYDDTLEAAKAALWLSWS